MPGSLTGGCLCGAIRYECSVEPLATMKCYCRDCQRNSGSAYALVVAVHKAYLKLLQGTPKRHVVQADSGKHVWREFCPECGAQLFAGGVDTPDFCGIKVGSLDDSSWVKPVVAIWTDSAPPWDHQDPALMTFPKNPPMPE